MGIDSLTIGEVKELAGMFSGARPSESVNLVHSGMLVIAVLERGFVYIGKVEQSGDSFVLNEARCVRRWGTTAGLGELAKAPTESTKLDDSCQVMFPKSSLIHFIRCEVSGWKRFYS